MMSFNIYQNYSKNKYDITHTLKDIDFSTVTPKFQTEYDINTDQINNDDDQCLRM